MEANVITGTVVDAAMKVHAELGPGLLESAYEACLAHELRKRGLKAERQKELPIIYDGERIDCGYRMDLLVENSAVVELKAVENVLPIHRAQLLSYLRLSGNELGLLINFHVVHLKDGISRKINSDSSRRTSVSSVVQ